MIRKAHLFGPGLAAFLLLLSCRLALVRSAEEQEPLAPPRPRPNVEELRERARNMTPEQRQQWIRQMREQRGLLGTNHTEALLRREELMKLPPAEREAKLREIRQRLLERNPKFLVLTPEEREAKRKEVKERVDQQIALLKERQKDASITDVEQRRLVRMEHMAQQLERRQVLGPRGAGASGAPEPDPLPPPRASPPTSEKK